MTWVNTNDKEKLNIIQDYKTYNIPGLTEKHIYIIKLYFIRVK